MSNKQQMHTCKWCGAETSQPDNECYARPVDSKQQTTLQLLIDKLQQKKRTAVSSHLGCIDMCIRECEALLELEKRQIIDAWVDGDARICQTKSIHHAEQYYKETYGEQ